MECKLNDLCGNKLIQTAKCQLVLLKFKTIKKFSIKVLNFVICHLYGTQHLFAISVSVNSLCPNSL